ncbi:MAG: hypothetical protein FWB96_11250 [Defluviitaleaceae bacterium]|nr:hypothetical protein [Defluviitaleaceae bacterium]MCL2263563.1 hypothetical protein [Defluviitaleaceae bacterium]
MRLVLFAVLSMMLFAFSACGGESEAVIALRETRETFITDLENFSGLVSTARIHADYMADRMENIWTHAQRETINPQTIRYVVNLTDGNWDDIADMPETTAEILSFLESHEYSFNSYNDALALFAGSATAADLRNNFGQARENLRVARTRIVNPPYELTQATATAGIMFDYLDDLINLLNEEYYEIIFNWR